MTPQEQDALDTLLARWNEPSVRDDFTQNVIAEAKRTPQRGGTVIAFPFSPRVAMAAAAVFVIALITLFSLRQDESVPAVTESVEWPSAESDDAVTELNRLIFWEEFTGDNVDNTDVALLLFATGS